MDELVAKFLPRFAALAGERVRRASECASSRKHELAAAIAHDLHSLAGEAGLMGLEAVTTTARSAEQAARRFGDTREEGDANGLAKCLEDLERALADAMADRP
jgi:HPt (histidine-containing phosphotransfer) domain-containing protein